MGSAGECSPEQLDARFRDNDFTLPPCVLDLLLDGLERAGYTVGSDYLEDPYYGPGPDRKVTRALKVVEIERARKEERLYLVHVPASVLREAQLETIGYMLHLLHVLASKLRRARQEREADGYQEEISKGEGPAFRVLVFSFELNQEIDRAFTAMFHDVDVWAGPKFPIAFVPWHHVEVLRDQNDKDQDRQIQFILENYALPTK